MGLLTQPPPHRDDQIKGLGARSVSPNFRHHLDEALTALCFKQTSLGSFIKLHVHFSRLLFEVRKIARTSF
jgi:hypothetical protein